MLAWPCRIRPEAVPTHISPADGSTNVPLNVELKVRGGSTSGAVLMAVGFEAQASSRDYRALVHDERFIPFFEAVTPIREISRPRIASRPVRRPGPSKLSNLRAIPWVMSWSSPLYP